MIIPSSKSGMSKRDKKLKDVAPSLWRVYCYFWPYVRSQRRLMIGSLVALLAAVALRILEPLPLKFLIDYVLVANPSDPIQWQGDNGIPSTSQGNPYLFLTLTVAAVIGLAVTRAWADYKSKLGFFLIGNHAVIEARNRLFDHLQNLSLRFHRDSRHGDLLVRVTRDVNLLRDVTSTALLPLAASVLVLAGMAAVMFWLQWKLALIALAVVPLFSVTTVRFGRRIRGAARKQRQREGAMAAIAGEALGGIAVVQALSLEDRFSAAFSAGNRNAQKQDLKANRLSTRLARVVDVLLALATALVMWFGASLVLRGQMSPGSLLVFLIYLKRSFKPAQNFAKYVSRLSKATAGGERVIELLERQPDIQDRPGAKILGQGKGAPAFSGRLCLQNASFGYGAGRPVLDNVNLEIQAGQFAAIVGPSGVGKSTLLGLFLRLYDPQSGRVLIDEEDIREYRVSSVRARFSVVLQDNVLFAGSIRENIAHGADETPSRDFDADIEFAARLACADSFITTLPDGYDSLVGERGLTLSHGQRQRIAIARAALRPSSILLLDEPTTGLDEENERAVIQSLEKLAVGRTTLLVTHDLRLASRADIIFHFDHGKPLRCGSHQELLQQDGQYASLFHLQLRGPMIGREKANA